MISTVNIPFEYSFSQSPVTVQLRTDLLGSPNLSILLKVQVWQKGAWFTNAPLVCVPDSKGIATFRIERLLHAFTSVFFSSENRVASKEILKYRFQYAESYGNLPANTPYITSADKYVVRGGLRTEEFNNLSLRKAFLELSPPKFLSTAPRFKHTKPDSKEFIYILGKPSAGYLRLNAKVVLNNGSEVEYLNLVQKTITERCVVKFDVGYNALELEEDIADVNYYIVFITDSSGKRSMDVNTYKFDLNGRQYKTLLYENSLGAIDTVTLSGNFKEQTNHTAQKVNKYIDFDWVNSRAGAYQKGQVESFLNAYKFGVEANTGLRTFEEIRALSDLLHSQSVWEWNGVKMQPVSIESNALEIRERDKHYYEATIVYTHANEYGAVLPDLDSDLALIENPVLDVGDWDNEDFDTEDFDTN